MDDEPLITVCRDVAGDHIGGPDCWCRPVTMTASEWERHDLGIPEFKATNKYDLAEFAVKHCSAGSRRESP